MMRNFKYDKVVIEFNKKSKVKKVYLRYMKENEYIEMLCWCLNNNVKSFYSY